MAKDTAEVLVVAGRRHRPDRGRGRRRRRARLGRLVRAAAAGGGAGAAAGKKVDVIIKASDSEFWQSMLAGAKKAGDDYGLEVGLFGPLRRPTSTSRSSSSRTRSRAARTRSSSRRTRPTRSTTRSSAPATAGTKVIVADTAVTTESEGFIGTDNVKAAEQAGARLCELVKEPGNDVRRRDDRLLGRRRAGAQGPRRRVPDGLHGRCPNLKVSIVRYNNNDLNTAASQVNDALPPTRTWSASSPPTTRRATALPARSRTTTPPTASRSSPSTPTRRRTRR